MTGRRNSGGDRARAVARYRSLEPETGDARAARDAAAAAGVSVRTLRRWVAVADAAGAAGRAAASVLADGRRSGRPAQWSGEGAEEAWLLWLDDYLRPEAPAATACLRRLDRVRETRGWAPLPSASAFLRRVRAEHSPAEIARAREGRVAAMRLFPAQERSVADLAPMEHLNGDGRKHDVFVATEDGRVVRPVAWYWQDVRSRKVLAWRVGETENSDLVRLSLADVERRWGVPLRVTVDNTHAASAACLSHQRRRFAGARVVDAHGLFDAWGIDVRRTGVEREVSGRGVGHGQAKPVERAFLDLAEMIDRSPAFAGASTGSAPHRKPANYGAASVPWHEFMAVLEREIEQHNARPGRRTEAADGRSFDEAFEDGRPAPRFLDEALRSLARLAAETTRIGPDGSFRLRAGSAPELPANRYWAEQLMAHKGAEAVARFDPADLHGGVAVWIGGALVCEARCLLPVGFADAEAARRHNGARRRWMRGLDASQRAREAMERERRAANVERAAIAPVGDPSRPVVRVGPRPAARDDDAERLSELRERFRRGVGED